MTKEFISRNGDYLIDIVVKCMHCEKPVKATVAHDYKRKLRKFCHQCKNTLAMSDTIYTGSMTDGCRKVGTVK